MKAAIKIYLTFIDRQIAVQKLELPNVNQSQSILQ